MSVRRNRGILKRVFLDEKEEEILRVNMAQFGTRKFSTYARRVLLYPQAPMIKVENEHFRELTNELKRIGNNINQLTKVANQTKSIDAKMIEHYEEEIMNLSKHLLKEYKLKVKEIKSIYGGY